MLVNEIRSSFKNFFNDKEHKQVNSAPMVIKDDPTLMFTNAGMNQFKDYFLGNKKAKDTRVVNSQKCLRVSGKHNDLDEVGRDTYHHTMFEMLGNWSFGDYFKKDAIEWAWELLTDVYKINKDQIYVTVFEGDKEDKTAFDQEAYDLWANLIDKNRIINGNKKDNFWEMGDVGPCGPCSEIHVDIRPEEEREVVDGKSLVNMDHPQVIEVWNLVFVQYNRASNGVLSLLPSKHVDTGMGLERLAMVLQGKISNYDTDVFSHLIKEVTAITGKLYGENEKYDMAIRVIVDHLRAVAFAIADGQLPSNVKAGYVIRRILRRAVRYAYSFLDFSQPILSKLVPQLVAQYGAAYPELTAQKELIEKVIHEEEQSFLRTLEKGLKLYTRIKSDLDKKGAKMVPGAIAFELYDTFGFPIDLTMLLAEEDGIEVDVKAFEEELKKQKDRSRQASKVDAADWEDVNEGEVAFKGYETLSYKTTVQKWRKVQQKGKLFYHIVLNETPFYAESGGQAGDKGIITIGGEAIHVLTTKRENDLIIHITEALPSQFDGEVLAEVDALFRAAVESNHSATHLMHAALREVLGEHVEQKGSYLNDAYLRFDFTHFSKVSAEELKVVEEKVNAMIEADINVQVRDGVTMDEAKAVGAMALFGEKYGDAVRMVTISKDFSNELCGGTHVTSSAQIGSFKIVAESSVAAGVRRIEALTGDAVLAHNNTEIEKLDKKKEELVKDNTSLSIKLKQEALLINKSSDTLPFSQLKVDLENQIESLTQANNILRKQLKSAGKEKALEVRAAIEKEVNRLGDLSFVAVKVEDIAPGDVKDIVFGLKQKLENLVVVIASSNEGKANITIGVDENVVEKGFHAGNLVKELSKEIQGGGGGQASFATAGGKHVGGLDAAVNKAKEIIETINTTV